jgi:tRNA-Thr(GGU) m(6)t(6)A37 methyltransferase TsaA
MTINKIILKGEMKLEIVLSPIGYIETPFKERHALNIPPFKPEAPYHNPNIHGILHVNEEYREGIADIEPGSYGMVIFYFNKSEGYKLSTHSAYANKKVGVFSTRSPNRPNGIGVSIVKFLSVKECEIEFLGVDMLDGTPLLDIKPYTGENLPDC